MKIQKSLIFEYPNATVTRYYFSNGYEFDAYNSGRHYAHTPTNKFASPKMTQRMAKIVSKFNSSI